MTKEEFRKIRKGAGLSVRALAERLKERTGKGSIPLVNKMESGETPIQAYVGREMTQIKVYGLLAYDIKDDKAIVADALVGSHKIAIDAFKRLVSLI